ncbi:MAG: hypothetical protein ACRD36_04825, partial [Candidatus Acidiferrum sp.]
NTQSHTGLSDGLAILDAHAFCEDDKREDPVNTLPRSWEVTSDSVAARAAVRFGAHQLILLKSVTISPDMDWSQAARSNFVDSYFPQVIASAPDLRITAINFRDWAAQ